MELALSSTILKFPPFFPASLQAKEVGISKLLMIRLVPSFKLKTKYLYLYFQFEIFYLPAKLLQQRGILIVFDGTIAQDFHPDKPKKNSREKILASKIPENLSMAGKELCTTNRPEFLVQFYTKYIY